MATKVILIDDLDRMVGRETIADEKVPFALDGIEYLIDLSAEHAKGLREFLHLYTEAAERLTPVKSQPKPGASEYEMIKDWLRGEGRLERYATKVPGKYRIPRSVYHEFKEKNRG